MNYQQMRITVQVGKAGVTSSIVNEIKKQLKTRQKVKIKLLKGSLEGKDKKELFKELLIKTQAKLVHKVGFVIVLEKEK